MRARVLLLVLVFVAAPAGAAPHPPGDVERDDAGEDVTNDGFADPADDGDAGGDPDALWSPLAPPGLTGGRAVPAPPIAEVLEAAYAAAGLTGDPSPGWRRRARLGGLVPWVTVRTGWDASWKEDDPTIDRGRTFEVRATWRLDRLVFDGRELQVATIETARRRERRRLASRVIRAYFGWHRLAVAASAPAAPARWAWRAAEARAELDALTDGWFSDRLAARRPSGFRTD